MQPAEAGRGEPREHRHHALENFRRRFIISTILTVPILLLSDPVQELLGIVVQFPGSDYLFLARATVVYFTAADRSSPAS